MKQLLLSLIVGTFFITTLQASLQNMQVTNIRIWPGECHASHLESAKVQIDVEGGMGPYTFSSLNPTTAPVVSGNSATFDLAFSPTDNDLTTTFTVTDSSSPERASSFMIEFKPSGWNEEWIILKAPSPGNADGNIGVQISDFGAYYFSLNDDVYQREDSMQGAYGWDGLKPGTYTVQAIGFDEWNLPKPGDLCGWGYVRVINLQLSEQ